MIHFMLNETAQAVQSFACSSGLAVLVYVRDVGGGDETLLRSTV